MFTILASLLFSWAAHANGPYFIEYGTVTLTDKTPSVTLPFKIATAWEKDHLIPEMVFIRMDVNDVENELTPNPDKSKTLCVPTVRALVPDGYIGINSLTYGGRVRASGDSVTLKALKTCGKAIRYKVRLATVSNMPAVRKDDMPRGFTCTQPTEGWCRK